MTHTIIIPGTPYPLKRARRSASGGMFDPKENVEAKRHIGWLAKAQIKTPMSGPVSMEIVFHFARPKSHFGKVLKASAPDHHVKRPDVDNLIKTVLDGMNGIAWIDDAQVVYVKASKVWTEGDAHTRIKVY